MAEKAGAAVLRIWVAVSGITQKALGEEVGVNEVTVSRWLSADAEPTRSNREKIAESLSKRLGTTLTADDLELELPEAERLAMGLRAIGRKKVK